MTTATATVWDGLVGQRPTIEVLQQAAAGQGMTHAWLFTGPPGSGRSNVARAFAAALQCERRTGCGECEACRLGTGGSHPDITWVKSETSVLYVDDMRDLVQSAAKFPATLSRLCNFRASAAKLRMLFLARLSTFRRESSSTLMSNVCRFGWG